MNEPILSYQAISQLQLQLSPTQLKKLRLLSTIENHDLKLLIQAVVKSSNQILPPQSTPTIAEWLKIATPLLCSRLVDILLDQEKAMEPCSSNNASYSAGVLTTDLKKTFIVFTTENGWVKVLQDAIRIRASHEKVLDATIQEVTPHSSRNPQASPGAAVNSLLLNSEKILRKKDVHNVVYNINFAAIHLALLQVGIIDYSNTFEGFKEDVEKCFQGTPFDWGFFSTLEKTYSRFRWQQVLHMALAISPLVLFRKVNISSHSCSRETLLKVMCALRSRPMPVILRTIQGSIWTKLMAVAAGTKTAYDLFDEVVNEVEGMDLDCISDTDAHFFFPESPYKRIALENPSIFAAGHDSPHNDFTAPFHSASGPSAPQSQSDEDWQQQLVNAYTIVEHANRESSLRANGGLPGDIPEPPSARDLVQEQPTSPSTVLMKTPSNHPSFTPQTKSIPVADIQSPEDSPMQDHHGLGTPPQSQRNSPLSDIGMHDPPAETELPPSDTQGTKRKLGSDPEQLRRSTRERKAPAVIANVGSQSFPKKRTLQPTSNKSKTALPTYLPKWEVDEGPVGAKFNSRTNRARFSKDPVAVYSHDGRSVYRFQPKLYSELQHERLEYMIDQINQQAGRNDDLNGVPIGKITELQTPVAPADPSPIYHTSYNDWLRLSKSQQQFIFKCQNILLQDCPVRTHDFTLAGFRDLLGGVDTMRIMHDISLEPDFKSNEAVEEDNESDFSDEEANPVHVQANYRNMVECASSGSKILNALDIPAPGKTLRPPGLTTGLESESHTLRTQGFLDFVQHAWREWALAATADAIHFGHIDCAGLFTYVAVLAGVKGWGIAVPQQKSDLGSLDAFGDDYDVDLQNSQHWKLYSLLLQPGDMFIMRPCVPHFALTLEDCIIYGGHDYCSQTLQETSFGIFQAFTAAGLLTNTTHLEAIEAQQRIVAFFYKEIVEFGETFQQLLDEHGSIEHDDGSHIIPHLPNFNFVDDVIGFLCLYNLAQIGSILDVRRYREDVSLDLWNSDQFIPEQIKEQYRHAKKRSQDILKWLCAHFELALMHDDGEMATEGSPDGLERSDRLQTMAGQFLIQQCRSLVLNKWESETRNVKGQSSSVKTRRIRAFIEKDFKGNRGFMNKWPKKHGDSIDDWILSWKDDDPRTYSWPSAPEGFSYKMIHVTPE